MTCEMETECVWDRGELTACVRAMPVTTGGDSYMGCREAEPTDSKFKAKSSGQLRRNSGVDADHQMLASGIPKSKAHW